MSKQIQKGSRTCQRSRQAVSDGAGDVNPRCGSKVCLVSRFLAPSLGRALSYTREASCLAQSQLRFEAFCTECGWGPRQPDAQAGAQRHAGTWLHVESRECEQHFPAASSPPAPNSGLSSLSRALPGRQWRAGEEDGEGWRHLTAQWGAECGELLLCPRGSC